MDWIPNSQKWKTLKGLSADKGLNKMWYTHTRILVFTIERNKMCVITWINLGDM